MAGFLRWLILLSSQSGLCGAFLFSPFMLFCFVFKSVEGVGGLAIRSPTHTPLHNSEVKFEVLLSTCRVSSASSWPLP